MHSKYHQSYGVRDLYYILLGAALYLEEAGFQLVSNDVNKNPKEIMDMHSMIAIALAEHRTGDNATEGYANNVRGSRNANGTYDHGLWQINLNDAVYTYLTSQQPSNGVNSNIPMFKDKTRAQLKDMMYDPFANAVAAIAIAQLQAGPKDTQGINNWSTASIANEDSVFHMTAHNELENHLASLEFESAMYDKKIREHMNFNYTGIDPVKPTDNMVSSKTDKGFNVKYDYTDLNLADRLVAKTVEPVAEAINNVTPWFKDTFQNIRSNNGEE